MTCHPIIADAVRSYGCDPVEMTALVRSAGCTFVLEGRAGEPNAPLVDLKHDRNVVAWPSRGVVLDEMVEASGVLRSVELPLAVPDTVAAASAGRPLRDLARIAGDPGMRMAHVGPALAPGRTLVILMPWTQAHLAPPETAE